MDGAITATKRVTEEAQMMNESQIQASQNISRLVEICTGTRLDVSKVEHGTHLHHRSINTRLTRIERQQKKQHKSSSSSYGTIKNQLAVVEGTQQRLLEMIPTSTQAITLCVWNLKRILEQLVRVFGEFSVDVLRTLNQIMRTNLEMYALLRSIQNQMPNSPAPELRDCIHFQDALGRTRNLQYEWFQHWEVFESMLRCESHNMPGEELILAGRYHLIGGAQKRRIISKEDWSKAVFPGEDLYMSMIIETEELEEIEEGICPRPGCGQKNARSINSTYIIWQVQGFKGDDTIF